MLKLDDFSRSCTCEREEEEKETGEGQGPEGEEGESYPEGTYRFLRHHTIPHMVLQLITNEMEYRRMPYCQPLNEPFHS